MDFDQAIAAHGAWKMKLRDYFSKRDGSLNHSVVSSDNKCPLGQWIQGEGSQYLKLPEYSTLKQEHARFHKAAGVVVQKADSGQSIAEDMDLGSRSEFASASSAVVMAIMAMKKKVQTK